VRRSRYCAVMPLSISAAACSSETPEGTFTARAAGTLRTSVYDPDCDSTYATRSPTLKSRTLRPLAMTLPAASRPSELGSCSGYKPVPSVKKITKNAGVAVVYDAVGKDAFMPSLDCLRPLGMMVTYGNASGPVPPVSPLELSKRGSLFLTRPTLFHYIAQREDLLATAREMFAAVKSKAVKVQIGQTYKLADAAKAHQDLEARRTVGSTVLLP
jgi:hypothetical protein